MKTTNPQQKPINQKRGPTTGNENPGTKRSDFMSEKSKSSGEKSVLAKMVTDAMSMRGRGQRGKDDPALESLHADTNVGRGPTKGNAGKRK
jgi:hypothetical protein